MACVVAEEISRSEGCGGDTVHGDEQKLMPEKG